MGSGLLRIEGIKVGRSPIALSDHGRVSRDRSPQMSRAESSSAGSRAMRQDAAAVPPEMSSNNKEKSLDEVPLFMRGLPTAETNEEGLGRRQGINNEVDALMDRLHVAAEPDGEKSAYMNIDSTRLAEDTSLVHLDRSC